MRSSPPMGEGASRLHPFELALGPFVPARFEAIRLALADSGSDPFDRDAWTMVRPAAELLRELRPDEGLGEAVAELVALVHAGYLFWQQGERTLSLVRAELDDLAAAPPGQGNEFAERSAYYVQAPQRRIWGSPVPGTTPEPVDGWFAVIDRDTVGVVAVFGLLPGRPGFTVAHVMGAPPGPLIREDGSAPFASILPGGGAAGLWSLVGQHEMLELGWRVHRHLHPGTPPAPIEETIT